MEGQGDLVSRVLTPITHIVTLVIPLIDLLTKSPDPPSSVAGVHDGFQGLECTWFQAGFGSQGLGLKICGLVWSLGFRDLYLVSVRTVLDSFEVTKV